MPAPKAVSFCTVGCKLNQFETNDLERQFTERGWRVVPFGSPADACVVNTCTVTARSDSRCRQALRRARRTSPAAAVIAVGCYAQAQAGRLAEMPEVDLVLGNREKGAIFAHLDDEGRPRGARVSAPAAEAAPPGPFVPIRAFSGRTRAFVKIQDGCDAACSYCIVPRARGPNRSLPEEAVVAQVETLVRAGYREVVLSGVHLGCWGRDLDGRRTLAALLARLQAVAGLERLRLSSIEPTEFTPELLAALAAAPKICPHFHVPLQSGSARVLRAMRRPYAPGVFAALVERLAAARPAPGIGADVIAGFPGETEEEHEETARLIRSLPLTYLHVFPFSRRPGTPAAALPGQLRREERERRAEHLRRLGHEKAEAFRARHVGATVRVLVETRPERGTGLACGLTDNYLRIRIDAPADAIGLFRTVRITRLEEGRLHGDIV
jgi:threonylcarbamoyladenosine tRNA methylthiotransferase MtaB